MLTCKLSNVINLTCEIFLEFYLAFSGYRIFFHVSANVQFPSRVSIHLPTQSIDEVSSTCSFHRSFNQNGKLVELVQFSTRPLIKSHFETTSDRFLRFHHFRGTFDSRILRSSNEFHSTYDRQTTPTFPRRRRPVVIDRKFRKLHRGASERLIDFRGRSRLEEVDTILEKRKFASQLNPWLCHASYVSFFSFLVPKNFLSPPPLPLPLPSRMVGCWGHRRRPSRAII